MVDEGGTDGLLPMKRSKRQSLEPTYDERDTGQRFHTTTWLGDRLVEFQKPLSDPFVSHTVHLSWRDLLGCLLRRERPRVTVVVGGDRDIVEDVLELNANYLGWNCTRRDEFNVTLGAALETFAAASDD